MIKKFRKTPCIFDFATRAKKGEQPYRLKVDIANQELMRGYTITPCAEPTIIGRKALDEIAEGYKWFGYKEQPIQEFKCTKCGKHTAATDEGGHCETVMGWLCNDCIASLKIDGVDLEFEDDPKNFE